MKIKQSFLYQMNDAKKSIWTYYIVIAGVLLLNIFFATIRKLLYGENITYLNGTNFATLIFIFVIGLCFFKDNFRMLIQNGISRKTLFVGAVLSMLVIVFGIAIIDGIVLLLVALSSLMFGGSGDVQIILRGLFGYGENMSEVALFFYDRLNSILANFTALSLGYVIALLYYRLSKAGKTLVSIGVPVLLFIVVPIIDEYFFNFGILGLILDFLFRIVVMPVTNIIGFFAVAIVCLVCGYLLIRKAIIKQK